MALDFSNVMTGHYGQMIIDGTVVTLELALGAWLLAMFIALVLVMIRLSNKRFAQLWSRRMSPTTATYRRLFS
jgi:polar amino acid transport system permease protein